MPPKTLSPAPDHFTDALGHHQAGRLTEAERLYRLVLRDDPGHADSFHLLGLIARRAGRCDVAVDLIGKAITINDAADVYHFNLGNALQDLGRLDEAAAAYGAALRLTPYYAKAHANRGMVLKNSGHSLLAVAAYGVALSLMPELAEAHCGLGNALKALERFEAAVGAYGIALRLRPDYAEAHSNLGTTLNDLGRVDAAIDAYRAALCIKPDDAQAICNLGNILKDQGDALTALRVIKRCLRIGKTGQAKLIFARIVKRLDAVPCDSETRSIMVRALTDCWGRPGDLAGAAVALIRMNPDIEGCVTRAMACWPQGLSAKDLFGKSGLAALAADPILQALLICAPVRDHDMERFLTMARRAMLEGDAETGASTADHESVLRFGAALARQCFINDYVFACSDDEGRDAISLRDALSASLRGEAEVPAGLPLMVAAYFPLGSIPLAELLLDTCWPEPVSQVLRQQIGEPAEERRLRATIPRLTELDDPVSLLVQSQYEEHPYPRWIMSAPPAPKPVTVFAYLKARFPLTDFSEAAGKEPVDILIAGCGTGRHAIEVSQSIKGARVLAVDLSLSSLSYAQRKTEELGLTSIDYAQADLLRLGTLERRFDIIESVGVLHHLADPFAGWKILLSLLRPEGFMKVGLYSETARRDVARIRALIQEQGHDSSSNSIRRVRQQLMDLNRNADFGLVLKSEDFFSTSACRDLLFHVQEHRFTLPEISVFLLENKVQFLGFELDAAILAAYRQPFPDDPAATDLAHWELFEAWNPDIFWGMYQFWVRKIGVIPGDASRIPN